MRSIKRTKAAAGRADFGETLEAECETGAAVVAGAAQNAGEAVVAAAAADFERAGASLDLELENHLGIETDSPAETQVELDACRFAPRARASWSTSSASAATESGASVANS